MSDRVQRDQLAALDMCVHKGAHLARRNGVLAALDHQGGQRYLGKVGAIVRKESRACEDPGAFGLGTAEGLGQLVLQVGPVRRPHDDRRHRAGPAQVVLLEGLQQFVDIGPGETAAVVAVVDVTR